MLKSGGHLITFSGNRTHHRAFAGIEDAGFDIRDTLNWHYSNGFPKSQDIGKAIDKWHENAYEEREVIGEHRDGTESSRSEKIKQAPRESTKITEPATSKAEKWDGWKTNVKPATDFIVLARKPLLQDAVYKNVLENGVGALNIDACRDERYPPNLLLSDGGKELLDEQTDGEKSRYFPQFKYEPKASKSERSHDGEVDNNHPKVKPIDLMSWLVRLVTRKGQTVLDPFAGSGTTGLACIEEGRKCILIERKDEYCNLIEQRINSFVND